MALYHLSIDQVRRSKGQSVVASAAYRAGEVLYNEYYGEETNYTNKRGIVMTKIFLPDHAPKEYADRETLWNAVEKVEEHPKAQLAYSLDIALQNEFTMEENIELARKFVTEQLISRGMIADLAIHEPDKSEIPNPHFHVLCPIRPLNPDGTWGMKQHRVYILDEHGNRIPDGDGDYLFKAVPTTDWGRPETLEHWRAEWARLCNEKFEEKGLPDRIDHRSFERQGIDQIPTVHEGPSVRQMEEKGILTDKGDLNRWIRRTNQLKAAIRKMLAELSQRIKDISDALSSPKEPTLAELVTDYYDKRNAGAWSLTAKLSNLKSLSQMVAYLQEHNLYTAADLNAMRDDYHSKLDKKATESKAVESRMKEITDLLRQAQNYAETKPVHDKWYGIKFKGQKEKFKNEHEDELRVYHAADRKLKPHLKDGKLPITKWKKELASLENEFAVIKSELDAMQSEVRDLRQIAVAVDSALYERERQKNPTERNKTHAR